MSVEMVKAPPRVSISNRSSVGFEDTRRMRRATGTHSQFRLGKRSMDRSRPRRMHHPVNARVPKPKRPTNEDDPVYISRALTIQEKSRPRLYPTNIDEGNLEVSTRKHQQRLGTRRNIHEVYQDPDPGDGSL